MSNSALASLIINSSPLPDEHRATSVEASVGRSPTALDTKVSCATTVSDVVTCLGNYIEYSVSKRCVDAGEASQSVLQGSRDAFTVLMTSRFSLPDKLVNTCNKKRRIS